MSNYKTFRTAEILIMNGILKTKLEKKLSAGFMYI